MSISPEKLGFVIAKAREFDVKDVVTDREDSSNPTEDAMLSVLEDHRDDPVVKELTGFIRAMSEDESYLLGMPLLPNHLEDGLAQLGIEIEE